MGRGGGGAEMMIEPGREGSGYQPRASTSRLHCGRDGAQSSFRFGWLVHLDFDRFGLSGFVLGEVYFKDSVLKFGRDLAGFDAFWKGETAQEAAVGALYAVVPAAVFFLGHLAAAGDAEFAVLKGDFDVLAFELGEFGFDDVFFFVLGDIDERGPEGGNGGLGGCSVSRGEQWTKEFFEAVFQGVESAEGFHGEEGASGGDAGGSGDYFHRFY